MALELYFGRPYTAYFRRRPRQSEARGDIITATSPSLRLLRCSMRPPSYYFRIIDEESHDNRWAMAVGLRVRRITLLRFSLDYIIWFLWFYFRVSWFSLLGLLNPSRQWIDKPRQLCAVLNHTLRRHILYVSESVPGSVSKVTQINT